MSKKQLHVIVKYFYPVTAGIETNTLETYSVLAEKGWNVTVHTSTDTPVEKNHVNENLITVITNGIENEAYSDIDTLASKEIKEKAKGFGRYILQVGRIYMIKNYETTIKALAKLPDDVKFVIAGAPDKNPS